MDQANLAFARWLAAQGHPVQVVSHRVDPVLAPVHVRVPKPANAYTLGGPFLSAVGLGLGAAARARGGRVLVNGGNCPFPDVNWVHYVHAAWEPGTSGAHSVRRRALHALHLRTERLALGRARVVIANSQATARALVDEGLCPPERVRAVYYGADAQRYRPPSPQERAAGRAALGIPEGVPVLAFIGALGDRRKGFDTLFEALRALAREPRWEAHLVAVGAGAELEAWRARVRREGMDGRVHLLGFRRDVPVLLAGCDGLVAPTRYEAYGLGVQEALCCGLPALVSRGAGVAERYPEALRGLLLDEPESPEALAAALLRWAKGRDALAPAVAQLGSALRARSWDDMAAELYRAACA
ncbi:MAG: glycosyltransferase family 4 protein [Deltaproteobacteria bacterium]|nr:glycosyltransferase family 4 protein [Deltaproteobacteria bacterium]